MPEVDPPCRLRHANAGSSTGLTSDAARSAQASLDSEVEQAKKLAEELEQRTKAAQDQYTKARDALLQVIEEKAKAQPQQAEAKK